MHIVTREKLIRLMENETLAKHVIGRALMHLHARQTLHEQNAQETRDHNRRGFTPADAYMGSSMAKYYETNRHLSDRQIAYWRKPNAKGIPRLAKYWKQLDEVAKRQAIAQG